MEKFKIYSIQNVFIVITLICFLIIISQNHKNNKLISEAITAANNAEDTADHAYRMARGAYNEASSANSNAQDASSYASSAYDEASECIKDGY